MFQYEFEKRPASANSFESRATTSTSYSRTFPTRPTAIICSAERARRPLPPRPVSERLPQKNSVPLKVWIVASASCFAVCATLVLATIVITKWGTTEYNQREHFEASEHKPSEEKHKNDDLEYPIIEKLFFKNIVANRDRNLANRPQYHPIHEDINHIERNIEKKDKPKHVDIPEFKPTLPDINLGLDTDKTDYSDYYNDDNLYNDYIQSNTMTSYLIEKIQELHDWINSDADFEKSQVNPNGFSQVLRALNDSLIEGNVTIVMNKLRDIYFGDNYTIGDNGRKAILNNGTDLLSFGILTLDVVMLHNIQLMAWENQEAARMKMLKDPEVFAFNALFMDPAKVESKRLEVYSEHDNHLTHTRRQNLKQDSWDDFDFGKTILENILEIGMSTARAAIHLGRAYKNTKSVLNQLTNKETNTNIQSQISRNLDGNTRALGHLQTSFEFDSSNVANKTVYTELECVWFLYCKNLIATSKLNAPYGTMARINGLALRMLAGELSPDKALDTMLYEAVTGWTDLKCADMFPRCAKVNAANVVMESIMQPLKKSQVKSR